MPTYEYRCAECGNEFEKFGRMSDPPVYACPACGAEAQRKMSAGAGLLFKGSGFYITDYRGDSYKKAAASDSASGGGESKGEGKGDSKAETKSAPKPEPKAPPPSSSGGGAKSE
jgi:putative FmdB family regulatory protein